MFRRFVSLLVIAGFLTGQLAAIPHAHGATTEEQQEHNATPHFHCGWFGHADHDHGHSHGGHGHSHPGHQHEEDSKPSSDDSNGRPGGNGLSGIEHYADAVFVAGQDVLASNSKDQAGSTWQLDLLARLPAWLGDLQPSWKPPIRWHPPDEVLDASDTYLTLRNLRI